MQLAAREEKHLECTARRHRVPLYASSRDGLSFLLMATGHTKQKSEETGDVEEKRQQLGYALIPAVTKIHEAIAMTGLDKKTMMMILWNSVVGEDTPPPEVAARSEPPQPAGDDDDEILVFGKNRGKSFSETARTDPDYIKWVLTNAEKGSYPQMVALRSWLDQRYEISKPAKSAPAVVKEKATGKAMTGPLKGQVLPSFTPTPSAPTTPTPSAPKPPNAPTTSATGLDGSGNISVDPEELAKQIVRALRLSMT